MIRHLKTARSQHERAADDAKVRAVVEDILSDIAERGDAAVRALSEKFDKYSPSEFRLSEQDIEAAVSKVAKRDLDDIRFAQDQVRTFAQHQKAALRDIEVETLPGVVLGRVGEVEDVMGAAVFLASDASALVTGTSILVDGGWTAG